MKSLLKRRPHVALALAVVLVAVSRTAGAAEGVVGWWAWSDTYAPTPEQACQIMAERHMGTWLVRMVKRDTSFPAYDCWYPHFLAVGGIHNYGYTWLTCASGYTAVWPGRCVKKVTPPGPRVCTVGSQREQGPNPSVGNPIVLSSGSKFQEFQDTTARGTPSISFVRYYGSRNTNPFGSLGPGWSTSFDRRLVINNRDYPSSVTVLREDGGSHVFSKSGTVWYPGSGVVGTFAEVPGSNLKRWTLTDDSGRTDTFAVVGNASLNIPARLVASTWRSGYTQLFFYNEGGKLESVRDSFNRVARLTWDGEVLKQVVLPDGQSHTFTYTRSVVAGRTVTGSERLASEESRGADSTLAARRTYLYEMPEDSLALTGIVDEQGHRIATWTYDSQGRVVESVHPGGADRTLVTYDDASDTRTVTNALGRQSVYTFSGHKLLSIDGRPSPRTEAASRRYTYDSRGFVLSATDWNGNTTTYTRDSRGLPLTRTEAAGTPQARTTTTAWHPQWALPTRIVTPYKTTDLTYDSAGNLIERTETDTSPHTTPYPTAGRRRTWTFGYTDVVPASGAPAEPMALTLLNPGAETGDLSGWSVTQGDFGLRTSSPSPQEGTRYFSALNAGFSTLEQVVPLPAAVHAQVDAHRGMARVTWLQASYSAAEDPGAVALEFLDAAGTPLAPAASSGFTSPGTWLERTLLAPLPPGARGIRLRLHAQRVAGTPNNVYFDNVRLTYQPLLMSAVRLLTHVDGPRTDVSDVTTYGYDALGRITQVTNALGQVTRLVDHDAAGRPLRVIDPNGVETMLAYDARGRLTEVISHTGPGGAQASTSFAYDPRGNVTAIMMPDGSSLAFEYDDAGRLSAVANAVGERVAYVRDAMGNATQVQVTSASGAVVWTRSQLFDELGRLLRDTGVAGQLNAYRHDRNGNVVSRADGLGHSTAFAFDALDRLMRATDARGGSSGYAYDAAGALSGVSDPRGLATTYLRDGFGQIIEERSPDRGTLTYGYDEAGNPRWRRDARGVRTEYRYDALNRRVSRTFPADPDRDVAYSHDDTSGGNHGMGRLTGVLDASGMTRLVYNALGHRIEEHRSLDGYEYTFRYAYNLAGRLTRITYPSGRQVAYARDAAGRVTAVTTRRSSAEPEQLVASNIAWHPVGPLPSFELGNGLRQEATYDLDGQVVGLRTFAGATPRQDLGYLYDPAGRVTDVLDGVQPDRTQRFGYDELDRLIAAEGAYGAIAYSYDASGNRLSASTVSGGGTTLETYAYASDSNRLVSVARDGALRGFEYLPSGERASDLRADGTAYGFGYDGEGRLVALTRNGLPHARYIHDAFGRRSVKEVEGRRVHFLHGPNGQLLADGDGLTGTLRREYIWLEELPLALVTEAQTPAPRLHFLHADRLGTVQKITSETGALEWDAVVAPFGELSEVVGGLSYDLRFPGQYFDAETGLHQNWHRDYDPSIGRYLQPEPMLQDPAYIQALALQGHGLNAYAYALNNPMHYTDPDGRMVRAFLDFLRNYRDMRRANTIGADKYFHCKANCEASSYNDLLGWSEGLGAKAFSEMRELSDEYIKGDPPAACEQDRTANRHGQGVPPGTDCRQWCSPYRPSGLDPRY